MNQRTKQLIAQIEKDPWIALEWKACHSEEVAEALVEVVDRTIFERDVKKALEYSYALRGLASRIGSDRIVCKAEACLGSTFRILDRYDLAIAQMEHAERLARSCDQHNECLGDVYKRRGTLSFYQYQYDESLSFLNAALTCFEEAPNKQEREISAVLLLRSGTSRLLGKNREGLRDIQEAVSLMTPTMPSRYFVAAAVNAISLAAACCDEEIYSLALSIADELREKVKGGELHPRVRGVLRWIRGLAFEKLCDQKNAVRCLESAISTFDRLGMVPEQKVAMADLARVRRKGKQRETNDRHILRLIEATLRLDVNEETARILARAKEDPSESNILAWRSALDSYVPNLEPVPEKKAVV